MILDGRHFVVTLHEGVRRHIVQRVAVRPLPGGRRTRDLKINYVTVSRHFTLGAAEKAARRHNIERGHTP